MIMECRRSQHLFKLCGILLLTAALLFCPTPAAVSAEDVSPVISDTRTTTCKGLKPFNNIDELLYQFYINLDSDCLFEMPIDELEKKWNTKILYLKDDMSQEDYKARAEGTEFEVKPYLSDRDAFYVAVDLERKGEKKVIGFYIKMTNYYHNHYGSLFPPDSPPRSIPPPVEDIFRGPGLSWSSTSNQRNIYCLFSTETENAIRFINKHWGSDNWPKWPKFKPNERIISCSVL